MDECALWAGRKGKISPNPHRRCSLANLHTLKSNALTIMPWVEWKHNLNSRRVSFLHLPPPLFVYNSPGGHSSSTSLLFIQFLYSRSPSLVVCYRVTHCTLGQCNAVQSESRKRRQRETLNETDEKQEVPPHRHTTRSGGIL